MLRATCLGSIFVFAIALSIPNAALAFGCRPALIPNGRINSCSNCHLNPNGGGPRNEFGKEVDRIASGCSEFWTPELAMMDSDRDGVTNGEELQDPDGTWASGTPDPGDAAFVTHPGVADQKQNLIGFLRGDSNGDGAVDISDAISILNHLFLGGVGSTCAETLDTNADSLVNLTDPVFLLNHLFLGGTALPAPYPDCAEAMPPLGCDEYPACDS